MSRFKPVSKKELQDEIEKYTKRGGPAEKGAPNTWDVSSINDMSSLFKDSDFNADISSWDVINVTNMKAMFFNAKKFNSPLSWGAKTGNVLNMSLMFSKASSFNQNISGWDISRVTNMEEMFLAASNFNQSLDSWKPVNVINMQSMFSRAVKFNQSLNGWGEHTINVTDMRRMFLGASLFNQPLNAWKTDNVQDMGRMFEGASLFNQPIGAWNVEFVVSMQAMFSGASMFNQPIGNWMTRRLAYIDSMFYNAVKFNQDISRWDVRAVKNMTSLFYNASSFNQNISIWNIELVENMTAMFSYAGMFNQPLNWNVGHVEDMTAMFESAHAFNQPIGSWNVESVRYMTTMFQDAINFNQDINSWNVLNVRNMDFMFFGATAFRQDIHWIVRNGTSLGDINGGGSLMINNIIVETAAQSARAAQVAARAAARAAARRQARAGQAPAGIAFQVHDVFKNINSDDLLAIIGAEVPAHYDSTSISFNNYISTTILRLLETVENADERTNLDARYRAIAASIRVIEMRAIPQAKIDLAYAALLYVLGQDQAFQQIYIKEFLTQCSEAYGGFNPLSAIENISCPIGIFERIILSLSPAASQYVINKGTVYDGRYNGLMEVINPLSYEHFNTWAGMCQIAKSKELDVVEPDSVEKHISIYRNFIREKLIASGRIKEDSDDPEVLKTYLSNVIRPLIESNIKSGRSGGRTTRKNKNRNRSKQSKTKYIRKVFRKTNKRKKYIRMRRRT